MKLGFVILVCLVGWVIIKKVLTKINELIDVVNELKARVSTLEEQAHPTAEPIKIPCKRKLIEITFEDGWCKEKEIEFITDDDIICKYLQER